MPIGKVLSVLAVSAIVGATMSARAQDAAPPGATQLPPVVVNPPAPRRVVPKRGPAKRTARGAPAAPRPRAILTVTPAAGTRLVAGPAPVKQKYQLPQTSEGVTARKIEETVNIVDTANAVKYLPSLFVRIRNYGDNQAVLATRTWGLSSSARTLIYADDILLSNLLGNNNGNAAPRWGMVAPEEIARVDFLYGPFAAMYPGNSIGGVLQITTRTPDKPEFTFKQTEAFQTFDFYKTSSTYRTDQTSASFGNRWGDLSVFVAANVQNSSSQPLNWVTTSTPIEQLPAGAIPQLNRVYQTANVIGAGGLLHTDQGNVKGKFVLDINDWLKATYTVGFFENKQESRLETYLRDSNGPTYGGPANGANFATANFNLLQQQLANAFALKTDTRGALDGELVVTRYDYLKDIQRNPFTVATTGAAFTDIGRIARLDGTNWTTVDAKGIWRVALAGQHEVSFGLHGDRYELVNPVYQTPNWQSGIDATPVFYSNAAGKTQTVALWAQDAWRFVPQWKLTLGARWESWRAFDGFNYNTAPNTTTSAIPAMTPPPVNQPALDAVRFSPKASLAWEPLKEWQMTGSVGVANRFPTVTELYQTTTQPALLVVPNPNLRPEQALATELAIERKFRDGKVRLSLFEEHTRDAIIAQSTTVANVNTSIATNIDKIRSRGAELAWQKDNVLIAHLELFGSITYVDARIVSDSAFVSTIGGTTAEGKRVPNVPEWRSTLGATYRPTEQWAFTVAGRWQSKTFATLDNIDTNPNVYQAFDPFVVVDARMQYKVSQNGTLNFGVDNIFNEKYHLFHPFPQRTFVISGKVAF